MRNVFLIFLLIILSISICFGQEKSINESIIVCNLENLVLHKKNAFPNLKGRARVRVSFYSKDSLKVKSMEIMHFSIIDSIKNKKKLEYNIIQKKKLSNQKQQEIDSYKRNIISILNNLECYISNKNYDYFTDRVDIMFVFKIIPE